MTGAYWFINNTDIKGPNPNWPQYPRNSKNEKTLDEINSKYFVAWVRGLTWQSVAILYINEWTASMHVMHVKHWTCTVYCLESIARMENLELVCTEAQRFGQIKYWPNIWEKSVRCIPAVTQPNLNLCCWPNVGLTDWMSSIGVSYSLTGFRASSSQNLNKKNFHNSTKRTATSWSFQWLIYK